MYGQERRCQLADIRLSCSWKPLIWQKYVLVFGITAPPADQSGPRWVEWTTSHCHQEELVLAAQIHKLMGGYRIPIF